jgi:cytochrome o ubiquinol oxidase subunit 1
MPLYVLGLMGVTRRVSHFDDPSLRIWFIIAAIGAVSILIGIMSFLVQIGVSYLKREELRDLTGDPWNGRTLEWATASPPPAYNFAFTPVVHNVDAWWDMKQNGYVRPTSGFRPIHMPKNTGAGLILAGLATLAGFALIWQIWWLAAVGVLALIGGAIFHTFNYNRDFNIPVDDVTRVEDQRTQTLGSLA